MAVSMPKSESARGRQLSAGDWVAAATEALVRDGVAGVAVEPLAARLGATKGSFYHHFASRDALISAALAQWESEETEAVISRLQLIPDPSERLRGVMAAALGDRAGGVRDAALLASAGHPLVKPVVERVTNRRLEYMASVCEELGLRKSQARRRALLLYTSYLGLYDYLRVGLADLSDADLRAYTEEMLADLLPQRGARA
jgi:AcrR family transcriptional regulator